LAQGAVSAMLAATMYDFPLTGAQKSFLRGLGQTLDPALKLGKGGLTPTFFSELQRQLRTHELVKLRFLGAEREERTTLCAQIADEGRCVCVGAVGHTALFYRQNPEPAERRVALP
jgi:RNA-binding protein